jgi:hypothetical protein
LSGCPGHGRKRIRFPRAGTPVKRTAKIVVPGSTLNYGQSVTVHSLGATGPATAGTTYSGSICTTYTTSSGGPACAGAYRAVAVCGSARIGAITLQG